MLITFKCKKCHDARMGNELIFELKLLQCDVMLFEWFFFSSFLPRPIFTESFCTETTNRIGYLVEKLDQVELGWISFLFSFNANELMLIVY